MSRLRESGKANRVLGLGRGAAGIQLGISGVRVQGLRAGGGLGFRRV